MTATDVRNQLMLDLFITALEGGIGYWAKASEYDPEAVDFYATVYDVEDDEWFRIDAKIIAKGYRLATSEWRNRIAWSTDKPPVVITEDTDWDFDAGDADVIVQLGLFGEVVYG
jgi:hypothetical protein